MKHVHRVAAFLALETAAEARALLIQEMPYPQAVQRPKARRRLFLMRVRGRAIGSGRQFADDE